MDDLCISIEGGQKLKGEISISGAKNAALPCLFATLLCDEKVTLTNVPLVQDIATTKKVLEALGKSVESSGNEFTIENKTSNSHVPLNESRAMRASILSLGPLLATTGSAKVPLPGGCDFGGRPIDIHISGLKKMGAKITMRGGVLHAKAEQLKGTVLTLDFPTFTGTENLLMAATLATGTTVIENAACEPEIVNLANLLNAMGAKVFRAGTSTIKIEGVAKLKACTHKIMPDRIEAGTYLIAATVTQGDVKLNNIDSDTLHIVLEKLADAGAQIKTDANSISLKMTERPKAVGVSTAPYPGFPTDLQAQFMSLNSIAEGTAHIVEHIWEQRFRTAEELKLLGANISVVNNTAIIVGVNELNGAHVQASDLRASASLVIAGLCTKGETVVHGVHHLQRGYEELPSKLQALGAKVSYIEN